MISNEDFHHYADLFEKAYGSRPVNLPPGATAEALRWHILQLEKLLPLSKDPHDE